jgi:hypothetical protein
MKGGGKYPEWRRKMKATVAESVATAAASTVEEEASVEEEEEEVDGDGRVLSVTATTAVIAERCLHCPRP